MQIISFVELDFCIMNLSLSLSLALSLSLSLSRYLSYTHSLTLSLMHMHKHARVHTHMLERFKPDAEPYRWSILGPASGGGLHSMHAGSYSMHPADNDVVLRNWQERKASVRHSTSLTFTLNPKTLVGGCHVIPFYDSSL